MKNNHVILLVHNGDIFYDYINTCIEQIRKFNDCDIYLILPKKFRKLVKHDVNVISISTIKITDRHSKFNKTTKLDKKFRGGFWKHAVERFFLIEDLIVSLNLENVFHLENDVMLYRDLSQMVSVFTDNNFEIATTFDNDKRCIPGFLYFKNNNILSRLNEFILLNNGINDMEVIPEFNSLYENIEFLPVIPETYDREMRSVSGLTTTSAEKYFYHINKFNSLFDAAAIGQYLGGVDPRNVAGNSKGFINESSVFNVSDFDFNWSLDEEGRRIPWLIYKSQKYRINNLHIHSKNLKEFLS